MNLENTVKYHFAKSTLISDSPRATVLRFTDRYRHNGCHGHDAGTRRNGLQRLPRQDGHKQ